MNVDLEWKKNFIMNFNPSDIRSIIILVPCACMVFIPLIRSIYSTSIEELFMRPKQRGKNVFFRLLALVLILIPANFVLSLDVTFAALEFLLGFGGIVLYFIWTKKEKNTRKYINDISKLNTYYKEKCSGSFMISVMSLSPCMNIIGENLGNIPLFCSTIIVSVFEILILCISMPELVKRSAKNYFLQNNEKMFIYERIEDDTVLCGDNSEISKAEKYVTISYDELKEKEIFHMQYVSLSKTEKKELRKKYKENCPENT